MNHDQHVDSEIASNTTEDQAVAEIRAYIKEWQQHGHAHGDTVRLDALAQRLETMQYHGQKLALYRKARKRTDEFWAKEQP